MLPGRTPNSRKALGMTPESILIPELREKYQQDSLALRETFERTSDGISAIHRRTALVNEIVRRLWTDLAGEPTRIAVVATGGFGRKELFPCSDIDVLYLCGDEEAERTSRDRGAVSPGRKLPRTFVVREALLSPAVSGTLVLRTCASVYSVQPVATSGRSGKRPSSC